MVESAAKGVKEKSQRTKTGIDNSCGFLIFL